MEGNFGNFGAPRDKSISMIFKVLHLAAADAADGAGLAWTP
jgi:hypothetical protein